MSGRGELTQLRARFVVAQMSSWKAGTDLTSDIVTRSKSLPVQVRTQGLTVALAMLLRENKSAPLELASILARWLLDEYPAALSRREQNATRQASSGADLLRNLVDAERDTYLTVQHEAIELLDELKLLADALYGAD